MITGDIATMGALIGAGLATIGMGGAAIGVGIIVGSVLKVMPKKAGIFGEQIGVEFVKSRWELTSICRSYGARSRLTS